MYAKIQEAFQVSQEGQSSAQAAVNVPPPVAPPPPPVVPQQCPSNSITQFPVELSLAATYTHYDSVEEPIAIDFKWSERTTPPTFLAPNTDDAALDEVGAGNTNITTLRYLETNYTMIRAELCQKTHNNWILPENTRTSNLEDIVFTFETNNDTVQYRYLIFVIPIIRTDMAIDPIYLQALTDSTGQGPFRIRDCFPTDPTSRFAYYSTCLSGYTNNVKTQNINVFVCIDGLRCSNELMNSIQTRYGKPLPRVKPPFLTRFTAIGRTAIGTKAAPFPTYVLSSRNILNFSGVKKTFRDSSAVIRETPLDAYKCVPFDPDKQVNADGKIRVDLDQGTILTDVMEEREAIRKSDNMQGRMEPGRLEKYLGSALGIILAILASAGILWFLGSWVKEKFFPSNPYVPLDAGLPPGPPIPTSSGGGNVMLILGLGLLFGFIGFLIGTSLA